MKKKMKLGYCTSVATIALLMLLVIGSDSASAQEVSRPVVETSAAIALSQKIQPDQRLHLSTAANNYLYLTQSGALKRINVSPSAQQAIRQALARGDSRTVSAVSSPVPVNDADFDFLLSRLAGFTQNGSSNAWCGQNVVVGYNDSQALLLTSALGRSNSFSGVAVSHDGGASFRASLFLDAGPKPDNFLNGEPVLACSGRSFYYASLFEFPGAIDPTTGAPRPLTGVGVNRSRNSGDAWSVPFPAVKKDANEHFVDKEWLAIDPNNPDKLYVSYTDFDFSSRKANGCDGGARVAIELVASNDGGVDWSQPVVVDQMCRPQSGQALEGSQVVVGNAGEVFVAWVSETRIDEELFFRHSLDGGLTFSKPVSVGNAVFAGLGGNGRLQGLFLGNSFPSLSIDRSAGASRGSLYLTWTDASHNQIPDFLAPTQTYGFGDVVFSRSTDKGATWTSPRVVSPAPLHSAGRDQFLPSAAVDHEGTLAICYFDRRRDPENNGVDHYCSVSHDQGTNFASARNTPKSWAPTHSNDGLVDPVSLGDYDGVSSDANGASPGFFSTFQTQASGNPDIVGVRF